MRKALAGFVFVVAALPLAGQEKKTAWPLSLADGLPKELPGYTAAPTDPLPDTDENEMGVFTQVARFFQRIESPTVTRQFQLVVQDYGKEQEPRGRRSARPSPRPRRTRASRRATS